MGATIVLFYIAALRGKHPLDAAQRSHSPPRASAFSAPWRMAR
jgi:hypothetical protein